MCLARCNGAIVDEVEPKKTPCSCSTSKSSSPAMVEPFDGKTSLSYTVDDFRARVKECTSRDDHFLIASYSRKEFHQTGDGHFSPIGCYDPIEDRVLILDVARFKYEPHWVTVSKLYDAMTRIDPTTGSTRGCFEVSKDPSLDSTNVFTYTHDASNIVQRDAELSPYFETKKKKILNQLETGLNYDVVAVEEENRREEELLMELQKLVESSDSYFVETKRAFHSPLKNEVTYLRAQRDATTRSRENE